MILYYVAFLLLCLFGIKISNGYHTDYLSKDNTNAIKGIFLLFVFISHAIPYLIRCGYEFNALGDNILQSIQHHMGQLVVVMFLFYSGFGIGESYKKKGVNYVKRMPIRRILTTLLNFDVAVLFFIVTSLILSVPLTVKQCFLSFFAWDAVGNSNWYIFCILTCYMISFLTLKFAPQKAKVAITFILLIMVSLLLSFFKQSWWYNTMWVYGAGFAYSNYKKQIERKLQKNYWLFLGSFILLFAFLFLLKIEYRGIKSNLLSISFAILIVIITMKVTLSNKILQWIGKNLFPMYIYQRLPMLFLSKLYADFCGGNPIIFVGISITITVVISNYYKHWQIKLD